MNARRRHIALGRGTACFDMPKQARARQRQEGIVMLIVMVLILVATSTGVWALQSTVFEQKASTALLESSLSRIEAECSTMAGVALEENMVAAGATLFPQWQNTLLTKYFLPMPTANMVSPDFPNPAASGFNCGQDVGMRPLPWTFTSRRLHERIPYATQGASVGPSSGSGPITQPSTLVVITGYGELSLGANSVNDTLDSNNVRGIHEVISISRAYFDSQN
jgi:hypothetical protein